MQKPGGAQSVEKIYRSDICFCKSNTSCCLKIQTCIVLRAPSSSSTEHPSTEQEQHPAPSTSTQHHAPSTERQAHSSSGSSSAVLDENGGAYSITKWFSSRTGWLSPFHPFKILSPSPRCHLVPARYLISRPVILVSHQSARWLLPRCLHHPVSQFVFRCGSEARVGGGQMP